MPAWSVEFLASIAAVIVTSQSWYLSGWQTQYAWLWTVGLTQFRLRTRPGPVDVDLLFSRNASCNAQRLDPRQRPHRTGRPMDYVPLITAVGIQ